MSEHTIRLPESLYRSLLAAAEAKGLTPTSWIASQISEQSVAVKPTVDLPTDSMSHAKGEFIRSDSAEQKPLSELLAELPTINSKASTADDSTPHPAKKDDAFGDALIADMARQGIHLP